MKACVIGSKVRASSTMKIFKALKDSNRFESVYFTPTEGIRIGVNNGEYPIFYRDKDLTKFDAVLPRIGASKALFGHLIVKYLRRAGVYVPMNSGSILIAHNKYLTLEALNKAKIPIPETYLAMSPPSAKRAIEGMELPLVMKLLNGAGGKGVMFADTKQNAMSLVDTLNVLDQPLFIERYVKNPGEDIRVIVIGNEAVASMKRVAKKGEKRANLSSGGKGVAYKIDSEMEELAIRSAKTIGADICGVDLIEGSDGPLVIELNICPGMKISQVSGINVEKRIAEFMAERTELRRPEKAIKKVSYYIERIPKWFLEALEE